MFGLIYVIFNSILMINNYYFYLYYPNNTMSQNFDSAEFITVLCIPIEIIMSNNRTYEENRDDKFKDNENLTLVDNRNQDILNRKTIGQIIEETRAEKLGMLLKLYYYSYEIRFLDLKFAKQIIFKNETYENRTVLSRCFLYVHSKERGKNYERFLPSRYFCAESATKFLRIYLIDKDQMFTSGLHAITGGE